MSTPLDYAEFYFDHVDKGESMKAPEGVAAPLEPPKLDSTKWAMDYLGCKSQEALCKKYNMDVKYGDSLLGAMFEAYAAAVSKNLQEELTASQLKVRKYKRYFCDKDTCSPLLDSCESETTCCLPCHLDTAEARIVELEKEIAALMETKL